jgi:hypothetical protein
MSRVVAYTMLVLVASIIGPMSAAAQGPPNAGVTIKGPLPLPVTDADNPGRSPFQAELCSGPCSDGQGGVVPSSLTVPSNVRFVIEFVSARCDASTNGGSPPEITSMYLDIRRDR